MKLPPSAREIDVHDAAEVLRISESLGVTELELREAIRNVGPELDDVTRAVADLKMDRLEEDAEDQPAEEGGSMRRREVAPEPMPENGW